MKKIFYGAIILVSLLLSSVSALADTTTYKLDDVGISVDIPSEYSVFTRHIEDNDPNIEKLELDKDDIISYLESGNMYLLGFLDSEPFEIYISMLPTNDTIQTMNELSQEDLERMYGKIKDDLSELGLTSPTHSVYNNSGLTFIKYDTQKSGNDYMLCYSTIHDSKAISVFLRIISGSFTEEQRNIIEEIAKSVKFTLPDETEASSQHETIKFTAIEYIIQALPITIIILIISIIVISINEKNRIKTNKASRNPLRIEFENTCAKYERGTLFLKLYVIYMLPLYMIINGLGTVVFIQNRMGYPLPITIVGALFELVVVFCAYKVRKNAMMLNKRGYKFLIAYHCVMNFLNTIGEDFILIILNVGSIILFYIYMKKRASLFNGEKNKYKDVNTINE